MADFPELAGGYGDANVLRAQHELDDKHHIFTVDAKDEGKITHSCGAHSTIVDWNQLGDTVDEAVVKLLGVQSSTVSVMPHPLLTKLRPLWAGRHRWTQTRKKYKRVINRKRDNAARIAHARIQRGWKDCEADIVAALETLTWKRINSLEGVTAYQKQNIAKLKANRLRLWAGSDLGFKCPAGECRNSTTSGAAHLVWHCPVARAHWDCLLKIWGMALTGEQREIKHRKGAMQDVFGFKLRQLPRWQVDWGKDQHIEPWDCLYNVATEQWALGCAAVVTPIWRWNVDVVHRDGLQQRTQQEALQGTRKAVWEAYRRYRMGLFPLTQCSYDKIAAADFIMQRRDSQTDIGCHIRTLSLDYHGTKVGFFYGGSRGNPGPGGSGSIIIALGDGEKKAQPLWAAATALGVKTTRNNIAELVGLHRMLARAVEKDWKGIHVVGDSALVLNMMAKLTEPKARRLRHWYRLTRKLADLCEVGSWTHHCRRHNKMAGWLANYAMDKGQSVMLAMEEERTEHEMWGGGGVVDCIDGMWCSGLPKGTRRKK